VTYNNREEIPREFALLLANSIPKKAQSSITSLSVSDLMMPIRELLYKLKTPAINNSVSVTSITKSSNENLLLRNMQKVLRKVDGYSIGEHRSTEIDGTSIGMELEIVDPTGMLKLLKTDTSSVVGKLATERVEMTPKNHTLQELYDNFPVHFKYIFELSMGRYLAQDLVTSEYGNILLHLNNNCQFKAVQIDSEKRLRLYSLLDTDEFVTKRLHQIKQHLTDSTLPNCSDIECGTTTPEYKVVRLSKDLKWVTVRGTKTNNKTEVMQFLLSDKAKQGDKLETTEVVSKNCLTCSAISRCTQFKKDI